MKNILFIILVIILASCDDATTPEPLTLKETQPQVGTEEYYANLRAYKKSDHPIAFGWWLASGGSPSSDMATRYATLPDSMDIISLWGGLPKDEQAWKELRHCQEVKGTRFVICMFGSGVEGLMKKNFPELAPDEVVTQAQSRRALTDSVALQKLMAAIDGVAKSINDTIEKHRLDGFDLDYEPNFGDKSIFGYGPRNDGGCIYTQRLFQALSKYMGPMSDTGKLLIIDGENEKGIIPYIDYLVQQAYDSHSYADLEQRYNRYGFNGALPSKKFVVTENMQKWGGFGANFTVDGKNVGSVIGMAMWNPTTGRKGGFGAYIIDADYYTNPTRPYETIRRGIQIQNPAVQ